MKIGFIGLGKMGSNMVERILKAGHKVVAYDRSSEPVKKAEGKGAIGASSINELVDKLDTPQVIWIMVPSGKATGEVIKTITDFLSKGDVLIDGGNSYYKDSVARATELKDSGIHFLDVGTSGGIWGLKIGYCLMIGGEEEAFNIAEPAFKALAPENGYSYVGPSGAGHFVKMVHNGIEYGMLQSYAEGFQIMEAKKDFKLDLAKVAQLWNQGGVIRSWLLELAANAFARDPHLDSIKGYVEDSGEGRWTVANAIEENVPAPVITLSLLERLHSRQKESFSAKVIAALRNEFGGHAVKDKTTI